MTTSSASLSTLKRANGSATYSQGGYKIICAVNGPIEVQRRDEIPDQAAIEVNVRPVSGVGGPRERHLETLIHSTFRNVILTHMHPRTLVQITLQILSAPENESDIALSNASLTFLTSNAHLPPLAALLNTTLLALLNSTLPLRSTPLSTIIAHLPASTSSSKTSVGEYISLPTPLQISTSKSLHVLTFTYPSSKLLLSESTGEFTMEEYARVLQKGREDCFEGKNETHKEVEGRGNEDEDEDDEMGGIELSTPSANNNNTAFGGEKMKNVKTERCVLDVIKSAIRERIRKDQAWM